MNSQACDPRYGSHTNRLREVHGLDRKALIVVLHRDDALHSTTRCPRQPPATEGEKICYLQAPAVTRFVTSASDRTSASGAVARRAGALPGPRDAGPSAFATAWRRGPYHCRVWRRPPDMLRARWVARRLATAQRQRSAPRARGPPAAQA